MRICDQRGDQLEHGRQSGGDRRLHVVDEVRQARVGRPEAGQVDVQVGADPGERAPRFADTDVSGVDAQPDLRDAVERRAHRDELRQLGSGRVLDEQPRRAGLGQRTGQFGRRVLQLASRVGTSGRSCTTKPDTRSPNFRISAAIAARSASSQQVSAARKVHHRRTGADRDEPERVFQLRRRSPVDLGRQAGLLESEPGQPEQGVVAVDPLLEQGMQRRVVSVMPDPRHRLCLPRRIRPRCGQEAEVGGAGQRHDVHGLVGRAHPARLVGLGPVRDDGQRLLVQPGHALDGPVTDPAAAWSAGRGM